MRAIFPGIVLLLAAPSDAAVYYISPSGSNANPGSSTATPWQTFSHALPRLACGDTLVLMDGVYGDGTSTGKLAISAKVCAAAAPLTIRALNQRRARIHDNGSGNAVFITGSSHIVLDGLAADSADLSGQCGWCGQPVGIYQSNRVTLRNLLASRPNRYSNVHTVTLSQSHDNLIEDSEVYLFHRHGVVLAYSDRNTIRRLYCNSRSHADIAGGYGSGDPRFGDDCIAIYPGSHNIVENSITEGGTKGIAILASGPSTGNRLLGNISIDEGYAHEYTARNVPGEDGAPIDTIAQNNVAVRPYYLGFWLQGAVNTQMTNNTVIAGANSLQRSEHNGTPTTDLAFTSNDFTGSSKFYSNTFTLTNSLAAGTGKIGFNASGGPGTNRYPNAEAAFATKFSPDNASIINKNTSVQGLGSCLAWIPDSSPLKRAGQNGADIGANILYRYQDGALTSQPLWDRSTGRFPCGAVVAGINDAAGSSCMDAHLRLNVNANGCAFPAGYSGAPGGLAPAQPKNARVR